MAENAGKLVVIETGAIFPGKAERFDQMEFRAGIGAQPDNVAGIGRNFRLIKDDGSHDVAISEQLIERSAAL